MSFPPQLGQSRFVAAGPHRLHYHEYQSALTNPALPPVILISGLQASHRQWLRLAPLLSPPFRVLAFDYLGVGQSDKPEGFAYTARAQAEVIATALRALNIPRAHLVGASYGGGIVLALAGLYPELAATVTAIEGVFYWPGPMKWYGLMHHVYRAPRLGPFVFKAFYPSVKFYSLIRARFNWAEFQMVSACYTEPYASRTAWANLMLTAGEDLRFVLPRIQAPILYLSGGQSWLKPFLRPMLRYLRRQQPTARLLTIPTGAHSLNVERPRQVAEAVLNFWGSIAFDGPGDTRISVDL